MREMIVARRGGSGSEEDRYDLFSGLLKASDDPDSKTPLEDDELIGVYSVLRMY